MEHKELMRMLHTVMNPMQAALEKRDDFLDYSQHFDLYVKRYLPKVRRDYHRPGVTKKQKKEMEKMILNTKSLTSPQAKQFLELVKEVK